MQFSPLLVIVSIVIGFVAAFVVLASTVRLRHDRAHRGRRADHGRGVLRHALHRDDGDQDVPGRAGDARGHPGASTAGFLLPLILGISILASC